MGKEKRGWRKEVKKLRRNKIRQKIAMELQKINEVELDVTADDEVDNGTDTTDDPTTKESEEGQITTVVDKEYFLSREDWLERERFADMESAMKRALEEKLAISRAAEERKIREEWEERERKEKLEKEEKERLEKVRKEKQDEEFNQFLDFLCGDIETPPLPYVMPEGFDTGEEVCLNFTKTGVCRFYDRCKLVHQNPTLSRTILITNFFSHFLLEESQRDEHDTDLGLEYEHSELYREFLEFHGDVLPEFQKHGRVIQFKICCNFEPHLRGNVYIQYENIRSAVEAFRTFNARFYNGKQISLRFVKIDSWKTAICWSFLRRNCIRGRSCNYLHVFRNPTKEFVLADRDWKDLSGAKKPTDQSLQKSWNETSPGAMNSVDLDHSIKSRDRDSRDKHASTSSNQTNFETASSDSKKKRLNENEATKFNKRRPSESRISHKKKRRSKSTEPKNKQAVNEVRHLKSLPVESRKSGESSHQPIPNQLNSAGTTSMKDFGNDVSKKRKKSKKHKKEHKKKSKKSKHKKPRKD